MHGSGACETPECSVPGTQNYPGLRRPACLFASDPCDPLPIPSTIAPDDPPRYLAATTRPEPNERVTSRKVEAPDFAEWGKGEKTEVKSRGQKRATAWNRSADTPR